MDRRGVTYISTPFFLKKCNYRWAKNCFNKDLCVFIFLKSFPFPPHLLTQFGKAWFATQAGEIFFCLFTVYPWRLNEAISDMSSPFERLLYWLVCPNFGAKIRLFKFSLSVVFQQKLHWSSDQWFHNPSHYFEMAWKTKMQTEKKKNEWKRHCLERGNWPWKCFH